MTQTIHDGDCLVRVFPRRTRATPTDAWAFIGEPPLVWPAGLTPRLVAVSCAFSWDLREAERLARAWSRVAPTEIGGPATGQPSVEFTPGRYLRPGYVITSRGCPNRCWFCGVWRREGEAVRELPITEGHNVLDDNLLACSEAHVRSVFAMLGRQKKQAEFTGGLEAARLRPWHVELLAGLRPKPALFLAHNTPDDWEPLCAAARMLGEANLLNHRTRCYVLCGHSRDTLGAAEQRLRAVASLGLFPMAMLYRDAKGRKPVGWTAFQRAWARPHIIACKIARARGKDAEAEEAAAQQQLAMFGEEDA